MTGLLLINKPVDWTSYDVIRFLKPKFRPEKIGHAGTLDPLATGLLGVGIGAGTKLIPFLHLLPKEYVAQAELGIISDTYDITGNLQRSRLVGIPDQQTLEACLAGFVGQSQQIPPVYSALKIKGQPAYRYARRGIDIQLSPRTITLFHISLLDYTYPRFRFLVCCSSGTYIRSLIHDIGRHLHVGAVMQSLIRTRIGDFSLENAFQPDRDLSNEDWHLRLIPPPTVIRFLPEIILRDDFPLENGRPFQDDDILFRPENPDMLYAFILKKNSSKTILAIVKAEKKDYSTNVQWKYCCVLNYLSDK